MREIIKKSKRQKYVKKCKKCGCLFIYQLDDIQYHDLFSTCEYVSCPDCERNNDIIFKRKYKEKKHGKRI